MKNINETKILVLRIYHHPQMFYDEFVSPQDLSGLLTHMIYDEKLGILLPRITVESEHVNGIEIRLSNIDNSILF